MKIEKIADLITEYYFDCEDYGEDILYEALGEASEAGKTELARKLVLGAVNMALESLVYEEGNELLKAILEARKSENWKYPNP